MGTNSLRKNSISFPQGSPTLSTPIYVIKIMLSSWSHDVGHLYQPYEVHYETTKSHLSLSLSLLFLLSQRLNSFPQISKKNSRTFFFTKTWQQIPQTPTPRYRIKPKGKCITIIRGM
jgi:hypothetical protein